LHCGQDRSQIMHINIWDEKINRPIQTCTCSSTQKRVPNDTTLKENRKRSNDNIKVKLRSYNLHVRKLTSWVCGVSFHPIQQWSTYSKDTTATAMAQIIQVKIGPVKIWRININRHPPKTTAIS
jgi:hypothetical protein